jgi:putative inorganic carbon (hco3(-)) transporter
MKGLIFTYAMTYGGALVSLFQPWVGLQIYICFNIIAPSNLWYWAVPEGHYLRIVAVALLIGWGLKGFGNWQLRRATSIVGGILGYLVVWVVDACVAPDQDLAWQGIESFVTFVLPFLAGITLVDSTAKLKQLAWVMVLSQGYLAYEFNLRFYEGSFDEEMFQHRGLDNNGIAITIVATIGMAFFLGLHSERWWSRIAALVASALMAHVVLFSMSRGGMLALGATVLVSFFLIPKQPKHYLAFALGVLLVLRLAGPHVRQEFSSSFADAKERDGSADLRTKHWKACVLSMMRHPLGVGPDHYPLVAPEYGLPKMEAHTTWLQIGAEMGIQGLGCLMLFYGSCLVRLWPIAIERGGVLDPWMRHLARMVIASLVGFIVSAQFVTVEGVELPYYITMIGGGVLKLASSPAAVPARGRVSGD